MNTPDRSRSRPGPGKTLWPALALLLGASLFPAAAAELTITDEAAGPTPQVLAYNLGHFLPDSNAADWWRYSQANGARIFISPAHFREAVAPDAPPVSSRGSFLAQRSALRADPYASPHILWPVLSNRFDTLLEGNNRILPSYALGQIHQRGGRILAQINLFEDTFPIASENDWAGKWKAWLVTYAMAFHMAREFHAERFASHNEPNHPHTLIEPAQWLMRLRLASDAVQCAIDDVNARYEKKLQAVFTAPTTAGGLGRAFEAYGKPAAESVFTDFLGQTLPDQPILQQYAYQSYNRSPTQFAEELASLRTSVHSALPPGAPPLRFAITEFNVHTGRTYDGLPESSDTLAKAATLGGILCRLAEAGLDEFYLFKFAMSQYAGHFPVQKNGMLFADNEHLPHFYGTMSRSAEAYRLFCKGFQPGRELLRRTGGDALHTLAARDPRSGILYLYSANESEESVPLVIDLGPLALPPGSLALIEEVGPHRSGLVRSIETLNESRLAPGNQPGLSTWLIQIHPGPFHNRSPGEAVTTLPALHDAMVRDGEWASTSFAHEPRLHVRNDPANPSGRSAAFFQFRLPEDWNPEQIAWAVLALPAKASEGNDAVHAHLYGIDQHDWESGSIAWNTAPGLRIGAPAGGQIRHRVVEGAGETAHILGQLQAGGDWSLQQIDVTDYLRRQASGRASFMVVQDPRWDIDIRVSSLPTSHEDLPREDVQPSGLHLQGVREPAGETGPARLLIGYRPLLPHG